MTGRTKNHLSPFGSHHGVPPVRPSFHVLLLKGNYRREDVAMFSGSDEPHIQCPVYKTET